VEREPSEQQPTSPTVPQEQKYSTDDSDYANSRDEDDPVIDRFVRKMVGQADQARQDE